MNLLDGKTYLKIIRAGAARLAENRKTINDLNVFPIPDGDTGDNMFMTIEQGGKSPLSPTLGQTARDVSSGMLLGARGNSGVILSRIFAGIAKGLEGLEEADIAAFSKAMKEGVAESYKAVPEPVEGTILTVFREGVDAADGSSGFEEYFDILDSAMDRSLQHTPELLDVLKKAGVVDSGGAGLLCIVEGMKAAISGDYIPSEPTAADESSSNAPDITSFTEDSVLEFGYCTEFLLRLQRSKVDLETFDETVIRDYLSSSGNSLVFFRDGSIIKVHVHTMDPGAILSRCREWGEYLTIKVENMTLQHHENHMEDRLKKGRTRFGIVAVASGKGLVDTFTELGATEVIEGGQTMNPPVSTFLGAFDRINSDVIFVLPNNGNILLTAQQAASLYKGSNIRVIPSKSLGAGYYALANMDTSSDNPDEIASIMTEAATSVVTGAVSIAIRDSSAGDAGNWLGISGKDILCSCPSPEAAAIELSRDLDAGSHDVAVFFTGEDVTDEKAGSLKAALESEFPMTEIIIIKGEQPVYNYILLLC